MDLTSNGYPVVNSPEQLGQLTPSTPNAPMDELREQLKAQGYLWLRGFFPREEVLALRRRYFERMKPTGILAEDADVGEGIFSGRRDQSGQTTRLLMEFVRMRLSTDIRYQRIRDEIDARWQKHWALDDML